jgi:hypothetical protein
VLEGQIDRQSTHSFRPKRGGFSKNSVL